MYMIFITSRRVTFCTKPAKPLGLNYSELAQLQLPELKAASHHFSQLHVFSNHQGGVNGLTIMVWL